MYKDKKIAVIVPAYNEEKLIHKTISSVPDYVDKIIVINDNSYDNTSYILDLSKKDFSDKLIVINHSENKGVGKAIINGYKKSLELNMDISAVMAGDAQMNPVKLPKLLDPIIDNQADYTKGNRLVSENINNMPKIRRKGNSILTILTKIASGYWNIMDPQNGYTAASREVIKRIIKEKIYPRYGYCNDILVKLNIYNFRVMDVTIPPVYNNEKSGIRLRNYTPKLSLLLTKLFFWRINKKYGSLNFHPLLIFYYLGLFLIPIGFLLGFYLLYNRIITGNYTIGSITLAALFLILGFQFLLFGMLFDEMENKELLKTQNNIKTKKNFFSRLKGYWGNDFHPLILFYLFGMIMLILGGVVGFIILYNRITIGTLSYTYGTLLLVVLLLILGFQSVLFAHVFELELQKKV